MKFKKIVFCIFALVFALLAGTLSAEPQLRRDFEFGDPAALMSAAREKFMNHENEDVVEQYKSFFEKETYLVTACKGEFGDWICFIFPDEVVEDAYDFAVFKYPSLDLVTIGWQIIEPGGWDRWYEEVNEEMDPDFWH